MPLVRPELETCPVCNAYLYSLKRLFTTEYEMISVEDLERTIVKG